MTTSTARREFATDLDKPYSVTLWGSNPDETDNDDCWTGEDFATREEALRAYREVVMSSDLSKLARVCGPRGAWEYVMLDGPQETHEVTQNPDRPACERRRRERSRAESAEQRELAMEAGMLHGVDAYNDVCLSCWPPPQGHAE